MTVITARHLTQRGCWDECGGKFVHTTQTWTEAKVTYRKLIEQSCNKCRISTRRNSTRVIST